MRKKLIMRYGLLSLPFGIGIILFSLGIYNIISSLLFFGGGYVAIKNICDCRKVKKNISLVVNKNKIDDSKKNTYVCNNSVVGLKRTNRHERVKKRVRRIDF